MMFENKSAIEEQATAWIVRTRDPRFEAWEEFSVWLERDPAHSRVYDELAAADAELPDLRLANAPPTAVPVRASLGRHSRRGVLGLALAASLVAMVGYSTYSSDSSPYSVETRPGERRSVSLADGSRIDLNGASRLVLDRDTPRLAKLERGEALFTIVHDEARPFVVEAGDARIVDAGTIFNVVRSGAALAVAVSEGEVIYNPAAQKVRLRPGDALRADADTEKVTLAQVPVESVGAWRENELVYRNVPAALVAADLARNLSVRVTAEPRLAATPFSGVIRLDGDQDSVIRNAAALLGANARRTDAGWVLAAGPDASR
jgi:transmembrane sensor